jgi:hypothetical protein
MDWKCYSSACAGCLALASYARTREQLRGQVRYHSRRHMGTFEGVLAALNRRISRITRGFRGSDRVHMLSVTVHGSEQADGQIARKTGVARRDDEECTPCT